MKIVVVTPARASVRAGNRHTAARWATLLRELGHQVRIVTEWRAQAADLMLALHARRSARSIRRWVRAVPRRPLIVALTGTDLYRDIRKSAAAQQSLRSADRLIVLQMLGPLALPRSLRAKTRVIDQSATITRARSRHGAGFEICVSGHLRVEKDPFRTAAALADLPAASNVRVRHIGAAYTPSFAQRARAWMRREPRYQWLGEVTHARAQGLLANCDALVITSRIEGGANVVSEALRAGVPVIASRIAGNVGMLGRKYPAYFPVGDTRALARLLSRVLRDADFHRDLRGICRRLGRRLTPARERAALAALIRECVKAV